MIKRVLPVVSAVLLSSYGCASTRVYRTNPEDNCVAQINVIENKKPNYFEIPDKALEESCLDGRTREVIFSVTNKHYRLMVDPNFNKDATDTRGLNDFLLETRPGERIGLECGYLRRLLDGEIDGITLTEK